MIAPWIAWHEARCRLGAFLLSAAFVAAAVAVGLSLELGARAREAAVSGQMDRIAPGLRLVPSNVDSTALRRLNLGDRLLPGDLVRRIQEAFSTKLRRIDKRLVLRHPVGGVDVPVIGISDDDVAHAFLGESASRAGEVVVGNEIGMSLARQSLTLYNRDWRVERMLPERGTLDDRSLFVSITALQAAVGRAGAINELDLYPHSVGTLPALASAVRTQIHGVAVFESADRRGDAETATERALGGMRRLVYVLTSIAAAIALFVSALLEVRDRRVELATLLAIGARRRSIAGALLGRFLLAASLGAAFGTGFATLAVLAQDPQTVLTMPWPWTEIATAVLVAVVATVAAIVPAVAFAALRDPVRALKIS